MSTFDYEKTKEVSFFKENVLPAHSSHHIYGSREACLCKEDDLIMPLDGIWKFFCAKNNGLVPAGFERCDYDVEGWDDIRVPAHIQMEGYGVPQYVNVQYAWDGIEELASCEVPKIFNPVACYVKSFEIPENMQDKKIRIAFNGAESALAVWLNGNYIGYSEDSFTPSEFDLTPYIVKGVNKLAVRVYRFSTSSWCEDQDFYNFSGIFRKVYIYALPEVHVEDIKVETLFENGNFDISNFKVSMRVTEATKGGKIRLRLKDGDKAVAGAEIETDEICGYSNDIVSPKLWSAEKPYLYTLEVECQNNRGQVCEFFTIKVGFRHFAIEDGFMKLNGKRIIFKGVNRHEFSHVGGRVVTREELETDIITMKRNNINAIRTCHYPNETDIYDLCDEYGLYMIDETNLETHATWDAYVRRLKDIDYVLPKDHMEWEPVLIDRVDSIYERDKNHPAVVIWSCGNEAFGGKVIYDMSNHFRELDSTRIVHYEGIFNDNSYPKTSDIASTMYTPAAEIARLIKEPDAKPRILCEYAHAMGNSCGDFDTYTTLANDPASLYQGGFIWDYVDQCIYKKDRYGQYFEAYGGDCGERPTDYEFCGNGIVYGDRSESPKMQEIKYDYQGIFADVSEKEIRITNYNLFMNTDEYKCEAVLLRDGVEIGRKSLEVAVAPGKSDVIAQPFECPSYPGEYVVIVSFLLKEDTLFARAGHEMAFGQGIIASITAESKKKAKNLRVVRGNLNIGVHGENFDVMFSTSGSGTYGLSSYKFAGREMVEGIARPNFWRAPTANDVGNNMPLHSAQWKLASMYMTTADLDNPDRFTNGEINPVVREEDDFVEVEYKYYLYTAPKSICKVRYRVFGDGRIDTKISMDANKSLGSLPEFGMMFTLNADYENIEWYGRGPKETYWDRKNGGKFGVYRTSAKESMAEYLVPQECGNRADTRYAKVTDFRGRGFMFSSDSMNFSALPYTPHELENARHKYELPNVHYTIVRVSMAQMGVGGDDSWGAPVLPEYHINTDRTLEFEFSFRGI